MRIAFISDIHGNFTALEAVIADIKSEGVDQVFCLGDTVTLGPQPREVLNVLRDLHGTYIKGNHDEAILDPTQAVKFEVTAHLIPDLYWCRELLTEDDYAFIGSFQNTYEFMYPNGVKLLAFHGSPLSPIDIIQATTPPEILDKYFAGHDASVFIGGHSHIQMHRRFGKKLVLNPGSVGNAFEFAFSPGNTPSLLPWAEYAIIEQSGSSFDVEMRRVYFDTESLLRMVKASGLPGAAWWLKQYQNHK